MKGLGALALGSLLLCNVAWAYQEEAIGTGATSQLAVKDAVVSTLMNYTGSKVTPETYMEIKEKLRQSFTAAPPCDYQVLAFKELGPNQWEAQVNIHIAEGPQDPYLSKLNSILRETYHKNMAVDFIGTNENLQEALWLAQELGNAGYFKNFTFREEATAATAAKLHSLVRDKEKGLVIAITGTGETLQANVYFAGLGIVKTIAREVYSKVFAENILQAIDAVTRDAYAAGPVELNVETVNGLEQAISFSLCGSEAHVGSVYDIYHIDGDQELLHGVTKEPLGPLVEKIGFVTITSLQDDLATGTYILTGTKQPQLYDRLRMVK